MLFYNHAAEYSYIFQYYTQVQCSGYKRLNSQIYYHNVDVSQVNQYNIRIIDQNIRIKLLRNSTKKYHFLFISVHDNSHGILTFDVI